MEGKERILLVEDDQNFGDVLRSYLEMNDYEVDLAGNGEIGLEYAKSNKYNLMIFDVMMPKKDGFTLAKEVMEFNTDTPIIFLTARSLKEDVIEGFKLGADDYITKPFNSEELLYRVTAVLRRSQSGKKPEKDEYRIGSHFIFNYPLRTLKFKDEEEKKLSPKEAELLKMFCQYKNEVLSRSEALTKIWGEDNYFTARSMDVFVTKLRKYLKPDSDIEIVNIHGNGFRLFEKII